jgi:sporulation protein YlmC with PRC-barrel domain
MAAVNISNSGPVNTSKVLNTNVIVSSKVTNDHGENLGRINKIMLDLETGKIAYAVLDITDLLNRVLAFSGLPNRTKFFAVPWELLDFSHHDKKIILNISKDILLKSPGFDTLEQVMEAPDFYWLGGVFEYFSNKAEWNQKRIEERKADVANAQMKREEITQAMTVNQQVNPDSHTDE